MALEGEAAELHESDHVRRAYLGGWASLCPRMTPPSIHVVCWPPAGRRRICAGRGCNSPAPRSERAGALRLARASFSAGDPRLATSLINWAVALPGDDAARPALLQEAVTLWRGSGPWLQSLKPEWRARSSTYHLRMETKYPGGYDRFSEGKYATLAAEGLAAAEAHAKGEAWPDQRARWEKERPAGFNDLRKLLGAVLLTAGDGVLTVDNQMVITTFNRSAQQITRACPGEEAIGRKCFEVMRGEMCESGCWH